MEIIYIALLAMIASGVGTLAGFGTSTIMVPILLLFFPLPQTLLLVGIIHWFGNIWKIVLFFKGLKWKLVFLFGIPGILSTFIGARMVFIAPEQALSQILGIFLIAYVVFLYINPAFSLSRRPATAILGGTLSGFFAGIFGIGGAVRGAFLSAFNLPKATYIAIAGAIGLAIDTARIATYFTEGATLVPHMYWGLILFIPASFAGALIAKKIVHTIPQKRFRSVIALFLLLMGIRLLMFP